MNEILQKLRAFFSDGTEKGQSRQITHESIDRSDSERQRLQRWISSKRSERFLNQFRNDCLDRADNAGMPDHFVFIKGKASDGLVMHIGTGLVNENEAIQVFDFLKQQLMRVSYRCHLSDRKVKWQNAQLIATERHYLKPVSAWYDEMKTQLNQQFGNVTIQLDFMNDKPASIRLHRNYYVDRKYAQVEPFNQLLLTLSAEL